MPVYIRQGEWDIPSPSVSSADVNEQDHFLLDPSLVVDELPQPFRMLNKILDQLLDDAWEKIMQRQLKREEEARLKNPPILQPNSLVENLFNKSAMCHSSDGRYVFVAFQTGGLFAFDPITFDCIGIGSSTDVCFEFISVSVIGENIHLLATIDDLGFARLFVFVDKNFFIIQILNEQMEGIPKTNARKIDLSANGDFCGLALECDGKGWVEFYKIPRDSWLREIEVAQKEIIKRTQLASEAAIDDQPIATPAEPLEIKFSPNILILKVKSPLPLVGSTHATQQDIMEKASSTGTVGVGTCHLFTEEHLNLRRSVVKNLYFDQLHNYNLEIDNFTIPSWHYLYSARMQAEPVISNLTAEDIPVSVCVWWSNSHLLQTYQLLSKPLKDLELKPDLVWPMSAKITCSTVDSRSNIIVLGINNGVISAFDRNLCKPISTVNVGENFAVTDINIVHPHNMKHKFGKLNVCFLVSLANGSVALIDCLKSSSKILVSSLTLKQRIHTRPFLTLPGVFLHSIENHKTYFRDVKSGDVICELALAESLDNPRSRFNFSSDESFLFAQNDDDTLQKFDLRFIDVLDKYRMSSIEKQRPVTKETIDERCQRFFAERLSLQAKRVEQLESSWNVMSKELFVLMGLTQVDSLLSQQSSRLTKWHTATQSIIAHQQALRH